jgi:hypothetical protein
MITPTQSKMARAALHWGVRELAAKSSVGVSTVTRFENKRASTITSAVAAMQRAFEEAGIIFYDDGAVRLKSGSVE